ncbi:MAG: PspC domain-containing protein [FCB group bacterium]|nr:PspC domain-containing protein [FCB group bacterium]
MKRVFRNLDDKRIAGVCSGIAEYFDIDPVLIRIIFLFALFAGGTGVLVYLICWFIIPPKVSGEVR